MLLFVNYTNNEIITRIIRNKIWKRETNAKDEKLLQ